MFRILIKQLYIKLPEPQLIFPVSKISLEKKPLKKLK